MNFFEQEMRKIVGPHFPAATYVGRACYIHLSDELRAKLWFDTNGHGSRYEVIRIAILNRQDGRVDINCLRLSDLLGKKQVNNPYFKDGIYPYIWENEMKSKWYVYKPTSDDYSLLGQTVQSYINIFQEQVQTNAPTQQVPQMQTM